MIAEKRRKFKRYDNGIYQKNWTRQSGAPVTCAVYKMKKVIIGLVITAVIIVAGLYIIGSISIKANQVSYTSEEIFAQLNRSIEILLERISLASTTEEIEKILNEADLEFGRLTLPAAGAYQSLEDLKQWLNICSGIYYLYAAAFDKMVEARGDFSYTASYGSIGKSMGSLNFNGYYFHIVDTMVHPLYGEMKTSSPMCLPTGEGGILIVDLASAKLLEAGEPTAIFAAWHEIGHLRQAELGKFDPGIAEIRNPMSPIREELELEADRFAIGQLGLTHQSYLEVQKELQITLNRNGNSVQALILSRIPELMDYEKILQQLLDEDIMQYINERADIIFADNANGARHNFLPYTILSWKTPSASKKATVFSC